MHQNTHFSVGSVFLAFVSVVSFAACKPRPTAAVSEVKGDVTLESRPPKILYHYGSYRYLHPIKSRAGTFRDSEWNAMPSMTPKYGGASRAGFYASQHPAYNERYEDGNLDNAVSDSPWLLTVTMASSCLEGNRWLNAKSHVFSECGSNDFVRSQAISAACDQQMKQFIAEREIGIVKDFWWEGFGYWYVTDKSCIEFLDATPEAVLKAAAEVPEFWRMAPFTSEKSRSEDAPSGYTPGQVDFVIVARALKEVKKPDQATLDSLETAASTTDIPGIRAPLVEMTRKAAACSRSGSYELFRRQLDLFVGKFDKGSFQAEQLNFESHVSNLVRYGLAKLDNECKGQGGPAATAQNSVAQPGDQAPGAADYLDATITRCAYAPETKGPDPNGNNYLPQKSDGTFVGKRSGWGVAMSLAECQTALKTQRLGLACVGLFHGNLVRILDNKKLNGYVFPQGDCVKALRKARNTGVCVVAGDLKVAKIDFVTEEVQWSKSLPYANDEYKTSALAACNP